MKTEQEVREAITEGVVRWGNVYFDRKTGTRTRSHEMFMSAEEVQDLAVIIGKALGVVK